MTTIQPLSHHDPNAPDRASSILMAGVTDAAILFLIAFISILATACAPDEPVNEGPWLSAGAPGERLNILLVTLDTTRCDRLGCYGYTRPTTPHIDSLAARGVLFERAVAPTPLTLPSHTTILTGLDPFEHGIRNNGTFVLDQSFTTLAEILAKEGWATGATLGAIPVDSRFGLDQGFESYDDRFDYRTGSPTALTSQRRAAEITDRALASIDAFGTAPFFHWAHYFDPHVPYDPPGEFKTRFEHPYDGEIAYMDAEIGRLVTQLGERGLLDSTWIVLVGDHGEALGSHGESTHGSLIYGATQQVPCIIVPPSRWAELPSDATHGATISTVVRLKDVAPTILDGLGVDRAAFRGSGSSLLPLVAGTWEGPGFAYVETLLPALEFGWSELRGVRTGQWSYVRAPEPELYDLAADAEEKTNVLEQNRDVARRLDQLCSDLTANETEMQVRTIDPDVARELAGLGYSVGNTYHSATSSDRDPKKLIHISEKLNMGMALLYGGDPDGAQRVFEEVLTDDPRNRFAAQRVVEIMIKKGEMAATVKACNRHLELHPADPSVLFYKAQAHAALEELAAACAALEKLLAPSHDHSQAVDLYMELLARMGKADEAESFVRDLVRRTPDRALSHVRLGRFELGRGNEEAGLAAARHSLSLSPDCAGAHALIGEILYMRFRRAQRARNADDARRLLDESRRHLERAVAESPAESAAAYRLAEIVKRGGDTERARILYEKALVANPLWPDAHARLADILWKMDRMSEALDHYAQADALGFNNPGFLLNYGMALSQSGQPDAALPIWRRALTLDPPLQLRQILESQISRHVGGG